MVDQVWYAPSKNRPEISDSAGISSSTWVNKRKYAEFRRHVCDEGDGGIPVSTLRERTFINPEIRQQSRLSREITPQRYSVHIYDYRYIKSAPALNNRSDLPTSSEEDEFGDDRTGKSNRSITSSQDCTTIQDIGPLA